jgi:hypothetical protein
MHIGGQCANPLVYHPGYGCCYLKGLIDTNEPKDKIIQIHLYGYMYTYMYMFENL